MESILIKTKWRIKKDEKRKTIAGETKLWAVSITCKPNSVKKKRNQELTFQFRDHYKSTRSPNIYILIQTNSSLLSFVSPSLAKLQPTLAEMYLSFFLFLCCSSEVQHLQEIHPPKLIFPNTFIEKNSKMDLLKDAAKNISLYDVKAYVRKAQNGMWLNRKVRWNLEPVNLWRTCIFHWQDPSDGYCGSVGINSWTQQ